ncbi:MAG: glycosyltransferase family 4 protein [Roseiflexaceae bacterium]|nr:glycosyltransferase family 4 protein [Roseiflexaceae bacterium]
MRILLVTPWLTIGGVDRINLDLTRQLTRRGYQFSIVATVPGQHEWRPLFEELTPDVVTLHPTVAPERQPAFMRDLIRSRSIQTVLVSNSQFGYALLPYLRFHCPDVAFIDLLHMEEPYWLDGGYPRLSLNYAVWINLSITISRHLRDWMIARGGDPARIEVCYANINVNAWNPAHFDRAALRRSLGITDEMPLILFIGRLVNQKRPRLAVQILRELARRGIAFHALIVGDGPERTAVERLLRDPWLRNVRLTGALPVERVREIMAAGDVLLLPSAREGIALVLYEAMAMGLVPVAADVGGQRELVTPDCGILIPPSRNEERAYIAALADLLRDPVRRAAMSARARQRMIDHFRIDQFGERIEMLIQRASDPAARSDRPIPTEGEAARSAADAINLARQSQNVARLWQVGGYADDVPLPPARRAALRIMRTARQRLRPWYRRLVNRDGHLLSRGVVAVRNWVVEWVYREG